MSSAHIFNFYPHIWTNSCTLPGMLASSRVAPAKNVTPARSSKESAIAVTRLHRFIMNPSFLRFAFFYYTHPGLPMVKKL